MQWDSVKVWVAVLAKTKMEYPLVYKARLAVYLLAMPIILM